MAEQSEQAYKLMSDDQATALQQSLERENEAFELARRNGLDISEEDARDLVPVHRDQLMRAGGYEEDGSKKGLGLNSIKSYVSRLGKAADDLWEEGEHHSTSLYGKPDSETPRKILQDALRSMNQHGPSCTESMRERIALARTSTPGAISHFISHPLLKQCNDKGYQEIFSHLAQEVSKYGTGSKRDRTKAAELNKFSMELAFRKYSFNSALIAFDPAEVEEYRSTASGIQHLDVRCDAETDARMEGIIHSGDGTERWLKVDDLLDRVSKYRQERSTTHRLLGDGRLEQTDRTPLSAENSAPAKGATTPTGGSTDAWLLDKSGLKMMRSKLQALSAGIEYAADNPVSVYITRRVLEECASVMSRCQTIMQANCSTARTNLGLPSSATVTDIKSRLRGKKDPVLRKARETIVEWEQNLEGYAALMPEVVGTVLSQVEAEYKKRRRTSRHSDPDTSEAALITVEAQNNWRDWRQKYSHLQDGIDYGNPNAPLTSFGINKSEMFKPDVRKSAQASLRELTTPVGYTPTLSRNARTAAFNAIDEILELRTAARAEMAQYISELEGTLNAPDRGNSDQDYSSILEAERAYLESSKAKADRNRLKDRKDRFSQVTYGTQDYEKWTSEACDAVLHEIDGKAKSLALMTADDPSENAMYGALARQAELDLLKLKRTVEQALEPGTRMSNRDYDAARKPLVSQSTQAMKELEGTAYEGASTLLEVGKIREALQPRASEEPSGQSATEPEETFAEALSNHEDWTDNARNDWSQLVLDEEDAAGKSVATTDISGKSTATPLTWAQIAAKK